MNFFPNISSDFSLERFMLWILCWNGRTMVSVCIVTNFETVFPGGYVIYELQNRSLKNNKTVTSVLLSQTDQ